MAHTTHRPLTTPALAIATLALGAVLASTPLAAGTAATSYDDRYEDLYMRCMSGAPRTADGHEGWSTSCHRKVTQRVQMRDCLSNAPATADAREA